MGDKNAALSQRDWHCSFKYENKDKGYGDNIKYTKLLIRIASIVDIEYKKIHEIKNCIDDEKMEMEINELLSEKAIQKLCKELEQELI